MKSEYPTPHNWEEIRLKYVTAEKLPYLTVFAKQNNVDYGLLRNYISEQGWKEQRKTYIADLFAERRAKSISTSIEQYQAATEENTSLALLLQQIVRLKLEQIKSELESPESYQDDEEEEGSKSYPVRSSDILNYANALKAISDLLKSSNDFAVGLSNLVTTGIITRVQATKIQNAIAAGDNATRLVLAEAFPDEIPEVSEDTQHN